MSTRLDWIADGARLSPGADHPSLTGAQLKSAALALAAALGERLPPGTVVGSLADNSPSWIAVDLALQIADMTHVPLAAFFSSEQIAHVARASGMSALFSGNADLAGRLGFSASSPIPADVVARDLKCFTRSAQPNDVRHAPIGTEVSKITFTSGTTGAPKGVLLSTDQQLATARSLVSAMAGLGIARHMCLLPLPVLLENVAGVYGALMSGASCIAPPLEAVGMHGSSGFDARRCLESIARSGADSVIVLPQMLNALTQALEAGIANMESIARLKFMAVGGARTAASLIRRARALGLPVYEGYGLSECASVVSLNLPAADRVGTVGRPLPGVEVRLADDAELLVKGRVFAGYLGTPCDASSEWLATGDLAAVDAQGFVSIVGRKKTVLITGYGRNVSPEWPEGLLTEHPGIPQALVYGDAQPHLCAVVVAVPELDDTHIDDHIARVNARLPDYARIGAWIRAGEPFTVRNGLATPNGRIRRAEIGARYADELAALYRDAAAAAASVHP